MTFSRTIRGVEVEVHCEGFEYSPDINFVGFDELYAVDMDGNPFEMTPEEEEKLHVEATQIALEPDDSWYGVDR